MPTGQPATERLAFHFDLTLTAPPRDYVVETGLGRYPLTAHTPQSRAHHRSRNRALALLSSNELDRLTHFSEDVDVPADVARVIRVVAAEDGANIPRLALMTIYIPRDARHRYLESRLEKEGLVFPPKLSAYGVDTGPRSDDAAAIWADADLMITPWDAAISVVFHHPELATRDADSAAAVMGHIESPDNVSVMRELATVISRQGEATKDGGWARIEPSVDKDGNALLWGQSRGRHKEGDPVYRYKISTETLDAAAPALKTPLRTSQEDPALRDRKWSVSQSRTGVRRDTVMAEALSRHLAGDDSPQYRYVLDNLTEGHGLSIHGNTIRYQESSDPDSGGRLSLEVTNTYLRTLGASVSLLDVTSQPVVEKKFVDFVVAGNDIMGIPVPKVPTTLTFDWPKEAASARLFHGGLGTSNWDAQLDWAGVAVTGIYQYVVPTVVLYAGARIENTGWYKDLLEDSKTTAKIVTYCVDLLGMAATSGVGSFHVKNMLWKLGDAAAGFIAGKVAEKVTLWLIRKIGTDALVQSVPFVGWAASVANRVDTLADLTATTVAVMSSPATYEVRIARRMALEVTVRPDPIHAREGQDPVWPKAAEHYTVVVQYRQGTTFTVEGALPGGTSSTPLVGQFPDLPAGGEIQVCFGVYSATHTLLGKWTSSWVDAIPPSTGDGVLRLSGAIQEVVVELASNTQYLYFEKLTFNETLGRHAWLPASFPIPATEAPFLDEGRLRAELVQIFQQNAIALSSGARIQVIERAGRWAVEDGGHRYDIAKTKDAGGALRVETNTAPSATRFDLNQGDRGQNLAKLVGITLNDKAYMLGYSWQASGQNLPVDRSDTPVQGQVYAFQNVNTLSRPESSLKFPSRGFATQPQILYDKYGPAPLLGLPVELTGDFDAGQLGDAVRQDFSARGYPLPRDMRITVVTKSVTWRIGFPELYPTYELRRGPHQIDVFTYPTTPFSQNNFFLEPTSGVWHLRRVTLDDVTPFDMSQSESWGRFIEPQLDAMIVHSMGYVIAVSKTNSKMEVIKIPEKGVPDKDADESVLLSGEGTREGLMKNPVGLAAAADGRVLVLESGNRRIQSFDVCGNPVPCFDGETIASLPPSFSQELDEGLVTAALREQFRQKGVELTRTWHVADEKLSVSVQGNGAEDVVTMDGAEPSTQWEIRCGSARYVVERKLDSLEVSARGTRLFTLDLALASTLDHSVCSDELVAAFQEHGHPLSEIVDISGNGLTLDASCEAELARGAVPAEMRAKLAARGIFLAADARVSSPVTLQAETQSALWVLRDGGSGRSYKIAAAGDKKPLEVKEYLATIPLHPPHTPGEVLDLDTELEGFIYVLGYTGQGNKPDDYYLDIYEPSGAWLCRTPDPKITRDAKGVNAAKLTVDMWRNLYGLTYEHFQGPKGRTEPTVATWTPSTPATKGK